MSTDHDQYFELAYDSTHKFLTVFTLNTWVGLCPIVLSHVQK